MHATPDLVVEIGNQFGPEVMDGLRLYNGLIEDRRPASEVETSWPRWFIANPFGPGLFAVARADGRVVGFCSLIAAEMRIGHRAVRGAKAEFLVVEPEFRKVVDPATRLPLPNALFSGLLRHAHEFGIEAVFSVPSRPALLLHLQAGAKPMKLEFVEYVSFFRRPAKTLDPNPIRDLVLGLGAVGYTTARRALARAGRHANLVELFEDFEDVALAPDEGVNLLVNDSPAMLAHRFAGDRHWRYLIREPGDHVAAFVFTRYPDDVRLAWWSSLDVDADAFASLLRQVGQRARRDGASNLRVNLPANAVPPGWELPRWGFVRRPASYTVFVYSADPELMAARTALPWRFTNAHVGDF